MDRCRDLRLARSRLLSRAQERLIAEMREHALVIGELCGVLVVSDRRAGHAVAIEDGAPAAFVALTTIDEIYPKDREG